MLELLNGLPLMRLHFAFRASAPLSLLGYTGSTWHGALGHALSEAAPEAFDCLYRAAAGDDAPRPFALLPHAGPTELAPGDWLGMSLTLAGPALALSREVMFAVEHLGARGLGNQHVPLTLSGVACAHSAETGHSVHLKLDTQSTAKWTVGAKRRMGWMMFTPGWVPPSILA